MFVMSLTFGPARSNVTSETSEESSRRRLYDPGGIAVGVPDEVPSGVPSASTTRRVLVGRNVT